MNDFTATELELLGCFGVEPSLSFPDEHWFLNDPTYVVEVDGLAVTFDILLSFRGVCINVQRSGVQLFELRLLGVDDIRVIDERGVDAVEISLSSTAWVRLQLRPRFEITQAFDGREWGQPVPHF